VTRTGTKGRLSGLALALAMLFAAPASAAQDEEAAPVIHTPWLALRFVQDGREAELVRDGLLTTEVHLARRPFRILLPVRGRDDVYRITAWSNDSIFAAAPLGVPLDVLDSPEGPTYFSAATGLADTAAGSGTLMLNDHGHHYLRGLSLGPDSDRHVFFVSQVLHRDQHDVNRYRQMRAVEGPLYLVAFFDENGDDVMQHGEYEFLVLRFED
jgi:hypothetical protein